MLIIFYTNTKYKNLLDLLPGNYNKKIFEGHYCLEELSHQKQNLINATDFIFLRQAFMENNDEAFIEGLKGFITLYPEKRVSVILQGEREAYDHFINQLIGIGIYNIATAQDLVSLREEIAECVSPGGMDRYKPNTKPTPLIKSRADECGDDLILSELKDIKNAVISGEKLLQAKIDELRGLLVSGNGSGSLTDEIRFDGFSIPLNTADLPDGTIKELNNKLLESDAYIRKLIDNHYTKESESIKTIEKLKSDFEKSEKLRLYHETNSVKYEELVESLIRQHIIIPEKQMVFNLSCENIHVGFIGSEARVGVTNTALAFSKWLTDAGCSSAYIEENLYNHCSTFSPGSSEMDTVETDFGYSWEGVDIYLRTIKQISPLMELPKTYNIIIHDFGKENDCIGMDVPDREDIIHKMDMLVLIGGFKGYERTNTINAFRVLKHMDNLVFTLNFLHGSYHEELTGYFEPLMEGSISFVEYMPDPKFPLSNQKLFSTIIKNYI